METLHDRERAAQELIAELTTRGVDAEALDDLVHDVFGAAGAKANREDDEAAQEAAIDTESLSGSNINNDGLSAQVPCILEGYGVEEGARLIREAAGEWDAARLAKPTRS